MLNSHALFSFLVDVTVDSGGRCRSELAVEARRLAAKTLAHMATTVAIRSRILQNQALKHIVNHIPQNLDEGTAIYLDMLQPKTEASRFAS